MVAVAVAAAAAAAVQHKRRDTWIGTALALSLSSVTLKTAEDFIQMRHRTAAAVVPVMAMAAAVAVVQHRSHDTWIGSALVVASSGVTLKRPKTDSSGTHRTAAGSDGGGCDAAKEPRHLDRDCTSACLVQHGTEKSEV